MTAPIQTAKAPLSALDLFPAYPTVEEFKAATGKTAPPFDKARPIKPWADPDALTAPAWTTSPLGVHYKDSTAVYPIQRIFQQNGAWHAEPDTAEIPRAEAAAVNVPASGETGVGASAQIQFIPRRALLEGEALAESKSMMAGVVVINTALQAAAQKQADIAAGKFTADDRALLERIAARLGV